MPELGLFILIVFISLLLEGFFSGTEIALISCNRLSLKRKAKMGIKWAKKAYYLVQHPDTLFATTLFGTNLCVTVTTTVTTIAVIQYYGHEKDWIAFLIASPLIVFLGELTPKTLFQRYSARIVKYVIYPLLITRVLFYPVSLIVGFWSKIISKAHRNNALGLSKFSKDDLRNLLGYTKRDLDIKAQEKRMIRGILDFSHKTAKNVYIPLVNVVAINQKASLPEVIEKFKIHRHARFPIFSERINNVVGLVTQNSLFMIKPGQNDISQIIQPAYFVPETQPVDELFIHMQKESIQMAVVVDEFGGATGIITLEDLVEVVVGEIEDEYDSESSESVKEISLNNYMVKGITEIDLVNEKLNILLPKGDYITIAGFLLEKLGFIPEAGQEFKYENILFIIKHATEKQIISVQITLLS